VGGGKFVLIGLSSIFFPQENVEVSVRKIADLGADCVEINCDLPHFPPGPINEEKRKGLWDALRETGLPSSLHSSFFELNLGSGYPELRELSRSRIKECINLASFLGSSPIVIHPGYFPSFEPELRSEAKKRFMEDLDIILTYAKARGVKLVLENIQSPYFFGFEFAEMFSICSSLSLPFCLDIGHAYIMQGICGNSDREREIARGIDKLSPFLSHIHIHDNHGLKDEHLGVGEGNIDFSPIVEAIRRVGFEGKIIGEGWEGTEDVSFKISNLRKLFEC
jgi:sugar phosphate isomerase/epimerase